MIVYTYGPTSDAIDFSPFSVKLQTWLRMAGLAYTSKVGNVRRMPKRKLPALKVDGQLGADSGLIIRHLAQERGDPLGDRSMSARDQSDARALQALVENELYFVAVYHRWVADTGWATTEGDMIAYLRRIQVPGVLAPFLARRARRAIVAQASAQGIGRHTADEIAWIGSSGIAALSGRLGGGWFMMGAQPRTVDASAFGLLHAILASPINSPLKKAVLKHANLVGYHERILTRWWPEHAALARYPALLAS